MSTLGDLLAEHTVLPGNAVDHLHAVVGEWQLLADLSFADYLMWVRRDSDASGALVCVAQCRPNTAATVLLSDAVGTVAVAEWMPLVVGAFESGVIGREGIAGQRNMEAVPVRHGDRVVAVLTHQTALTGRRESSRLEAAYLDCAADLVHMLSEGTFPDVGDIAVSRSSPRVGDGFIRLGVDGTVTYASPNALSAYHRMGLAAELAGHDLVAVTRPLISDSFEAHELAEHVRDSLAGGSSMRFEVDAAGAVVLLRTLPLVVDGRPAPAPRRVRDVTEVKRRDRALLSKDATIREIHHRVKNNLQTVAALLRLQARRMTEPAARAALEESVRRVASIAVVHETLAGSREDVVDVDDVLDQVMPMLGDLTSVGPAARTRRIGTFGELPAAAATPLVLVVTELLHNAAEHAFPDGEPGMIELVAERTGEDLVVRVRENGKGLPEGFDAAGSDGLGLQIVRTLVTSELGGSLSMGSPADQPGTEVVLVLPGAGLPRR
jgi:two-component sensor histidine kinase